MGVKSLFITAEKGHLTFHRKRLCFRISHEMVLKRGYLTFYDFG